MLTQTLSLAHTINAALESGPQQQIEQLLKRHFLKSFIKDKHKLKALSQEFANRHYIHLKNFVPPLLQTGARGEVAELLTHFLKAISVTKNTLPSLPNTSAVRQIDIERAGIIIPALYDSQSLRQLLLFITGTELISYSSGDKGISITRITQADSCEDWKYIQQTYQLVWFVETSRTKPDGAVEFTTSSLKNKSMARTNQMTTDYIQRKYPRSGDAFLLKSGTCLHRFSPLTQGSELVFVTMGFTHAPRFENN